MLVLQEKKMTDYKDTVYLPKTDFFMRAGLRAKERQIFKVWVGLDFNLQLKMD